MIKKRKIKKIIRKQLKNKKITFKKVRKKYSKLGVIIMDYIDIIR